MSNAALGDDAVIGGGDLLVAGQKGQPVHVGLIERHPGARRIQLGRGARRKRAFLSSRSWSDTTPFG